MPEVFDWNEIDRALRAQTDLPLKIDRAWTEARAREVADGRLSAATNRLAADPRPAGPDDVDSLEGLPPAEQRELETLGRELLAQGKVACAVLNGGMATRFGGAVKGVVPVIGRRTFLEIKLRQALTAGRVPFLIMNSFATHAATQDLLGKLEGLPQGEVRCFLQSAALRLDPSGRPFRDRSGAFSFYAPGHGEFPLALQRCGELARLSSAGVELVVLSNVDNLGADLDPRVLGYHRARGHAITCEVARTAPGDKGGSPARADGRLQIVEGFRFPAAFDFDRLVYLSTNTFVFSLEALRGEHPPRWYYVEKEVDGAKAVQIESVVNELTQQLSTGFLDVPRSGPRGRFFPVKTPADLDALRADPALVQRFSA